MVNRKYLDLPRYREINPLSRYNIVLVGERVKPAATNGFWASETGAMLSVLDSLGLPHSDVMDRDNDGSSGINVYGNQDVKERLDQTQTPNIHRDAGKMYGFPECCVEKYVGPGSTTRYWRQLARQIARSGTYPIEIDFVEHVPCDIECKETLELGARIKDTLKEYDPAAAEVKRIFERNGNRRAAKERGTLTDKLVGGLFRGFRYLTSHRVPEDRIEVGEEFREPWEFFSCNYIGTGRLLTVLPTGHQSEYQGRVVVTTRGDGLPLIVAFDHKTPPDPETGRRTFSIDSSKNWTGLEVFPSGDKVKITTADGGLKIYESQDKALIGAIAAFKDSIGKYDV